MSVRTLFNASRAFRLLPVLIVALASFAYARGNAAAPDLSEPGAASGEMTPIVEIAPTAARPNSSLAISIHTTTPWNTIMNEQYHDVTVSFCWDAGSMSSHSITSPNGLVIEDAAATCPPGKEQTAYFVRWTSTEPNPLDYGPNHIYIEYCDQWYQCTQVDGIIKYYPLLDSLDFPAQPTKVVPLGGYDTVVFAVTNTHSALSYAYDSVAAICHPGVGDCSIVGDNDLLLPNRGKDTIRVRFRGDTVGPSAVSMTYCRSGPVCYSRGQTVGVVPVDPVARAVTVTPIAATTNKGGNTTFTLGYRFQNTGTASTLYTLKVACDATVIASGCALARDTITLGASATDSVFTTTLTSTNPGALTTGAVIATAYAGNARASGQTALTVGPGGGAGLTDSISVTTIGLNPAGSVARGQCLMLAAGDAAGVECGDLRLSHGLPPFETVSRARGAGLIYLSRHAEGVPLLNANVRTLAGDPDSVKLTLTIGGVPQTRWFAWPSSCNNQQCRVVLPVKPGGSALATGWYQYSLQAEMVVGGTPYTSTVDTGSIAVVNRRNSPYGRGWWVQGMEQLIHLTDTTRKLWIGGDGSTRIFKKVSINSAYFTSEYALARIDTLRRVSSTDWRRLLPNGAYVRFNDVGEHIRTISTMGDTTKFIYHSSGTLTRLQLPTRGASTLPHYSFHYSGSGASRMLDSIRARPDSTGSVWRTTKLTRTGFNVSEFWDPADTIAIRFGLDTTTGRATWRRTRMKDTVFFTYDSLGGVSQTEISMSRTADSDIITNICSAETRSLVNCGWGQATAVGGVPVPDVVTRVDGPLSGLVDQSTFYLNRFGSPDTVQAPDGGVIRLERNATFPLLVNKRSGPTAQYTQAWYNNRGLVDSTSAPGIAGTRAVTRIKWNTKWDLPDTIRPPMGPYTRFWNRTSKAIVDSQQTGTTVSSRVRYTYDTTTTMWRVTGSVQPGLTESYAYDTTLGNVSRVQANDAVTRIYRNQYGFDTLTHDKDSLPWLRTSSYRNPMGRVDSTRSRSRASSYMLTNGGVGDTILAGTLIVRNNYDPAGNLTGVWRGDSASVFSTSASQTYWTYDAARRMRTRYEPLGTDSFFYDAGSRQTRIRNARGLVVRQYFDNMGRLLARATPEVTYARTGCTECTSPVLLYNPIYFPYYPTYMVGGGRAPEVVIPGDVESFAYDALGRMTRANNREARISRGYEENGALVADTLRMRKYDPTSISFAGATTYALNHTVDVLGRRTQRLDSHGGRQTYAYNDTLGTLIRSVDVDMYNDSLIFEFEHDSAGQLTEYSVPGRLTETMTYNSNGRLTARTAGAFTDSYQYDERGKQTYRATTTGDPTLEDESRMHYNGFGALVAIDRYRPYGAWSVFTNEYQMDALGNQAQDDATRGWTTGRSRYNRTYAGERITSSGANPLSALRDPTNSAHPLIKRIDTTYYGYDASGNQSWTRQVVLKHHYSSYGTDFWHDGGFVDGDNTRSYYDANNRLRQFERNTRQTSEWHTIQEYRYDALGRRLMVRTQHDSMTACSNPCLSSLDRFLWDGDNLMVEYRRTGGASLTFAQLDSSLATTGDFFGTVRYSHAGGIDQPLAIAKAGSGKFLPIRTGRGGYEGGIYTSDGSDMDDFHWPERYSGVQLGGDTRIEAPPATGWYGSLLENKTDFSGLIYMRNRYYDPSSGRFTQRDPIGLAGGINQYGYVGGDPVNHSDPFGLCKSGDVRCSWFEAGMTGLGAVAGFIAGGGAGVAMTVLTGGVAAPAALQVAAASTAIGATAGLALARNISGHEDEAADGAGDDNGRAVGLRRQLSEHEKKLADYRANPDANDNLGLLRNATAEQRERIIQGRIRNLERQIRNFKKQIEQAEGGSP